MTKKLLVMAGGTGGHVFPGLAVAEHLRNAGWEVNWLGTKDRMEARIVPEHNINIHFINIAGVRGNGIVRLLKAPFMIINAIWQAIKVLRKTKPNIVLGMGGYASGPGGLAAWLMGVPLILHEQNATPGMTNKLLAPLARKVLTGFAVPEWKIKGTKIKQVGNPVRATFSSVSEKLEVNDPLRILVCGGSLGARVLNETVPKAIALLLKNASSDNMQVWHQTGKGNQESVQLAYNKAGIAQEAAEVAEFITDMNTAYDWADVVICRAGALTVSEVALAGRCAIFVPLPHAVDDHQTRNAKYLESKGAAFILSQNHLNADSLGQLLRELSQDKDKIVQMSHSARGLGVRSATSVVAQICDEEAKYRV